MKRKLLAGILATLILAPTQGVTSANAVVFGEEIVDASSSKPWVVSIWWAEDASADGYRICTGSLIAPDVVMTAAHCVLSSGLYWIQASSDTLNGEGDFSEVDSVWKSPRYSSSKLVNDIGLMKLTKPLVSITPIPFAKKNLLSSIDKLKTYELYGWGIDQNGDDPTFLRYAKLNNELTSAKKLWSKYGFNSTTMMAAGKYLRSEGVYAGACNGDSGGPLTARIKGVETLVGITSWGANKCNKRLPSVFTKVAYYESDIAAGVISLRRGAVVSNRALPANITPPYLSGNLTAGSSITCETGTWSENTSRLTFRWTSPWSNSYSNSRTLQIPETYTDTTYTCSVTASNSNGSISLETTATVAGKPMAAGWPRISYSALRVGAIATCSGQGWTGRNVSEATRWFTSPAPSYVESNFIATGTQIEFTPELVAAIGSNRYLHCEVIGSNSGGSTRLTTNVYLLLPFAK